MENRKFLVDYKHQIQSFSEKIRTAMYKEILRTTHKSPYIWCDDKEYFWFDGKKKTRTLELLKICSLIDALVQITKIDHPDETFEEIMPFFEGIIKRYWKYYKMK